MSLQDSTFTTSRVMDNEIVKASDFEFAFEKLVENVSKATQMILESEQDFVINGKVLPYQGMNVQISPIYGVCKSTGVPFGRTEQAVMEFGFAESTSGRIDIIEVQGGWETYDNQQRAFNDPDTDVKTYQYVDTKKLMRPVFRIKQGTEGTLVAPEVDEGYVKLAEVVIRANNSTIEEEDIKNITADIAGMENEDWTTEPTATYNIGYISDVNARFRVAHNEDGTHKEDCIDATMLDIGTGLNQVNGNNLPIGGAVSIPTETISSSDSILSVIVKAASMITSLYNSYLKFGSYGFNGVLSVSSIADENNNLTKPIQIVASGDGSAVIKIDGNAVLSIDANGKLSTNGYTATSNNHIVTKVVTDAISTALTNLTTRVTNIENTLSDTSLYINKTLSSGTNGRYNVDSLSIVVATTANITLSGTQTIDGQALAVGNNVLVKDQTDAKTNGLYRVESSLWTRVTGYTTPANLKGKIFNITNGTTNGGKMFYLPNETFISSSSFGNDNINFVEYFGSVASKPGKAVIRNSSGNIEGNVTGSSGSCTGNAATATKLANARTLNIQDADGTNTGTGASFDGSGNATIKLPSTIKASITGNCSGTATSAGKWTTARNISISDADGTNTGTAVSVDGSANKTLKLPSTIKAALSGNASTATSAGNAATLAIATCSTASGTAAKVATLANFALVTGCKISIIFSNANSAANPTLNVNSTGAKGIRIGSGASSTDPAAPSTTSTAWNGILANTVYEAFYNGSVWILSRADGPSLGVKACYFSTSGGYIKYTNGLIIQWLYRLNGGTSTLYYDYPIAFTSTPTVIGTICITTSESRKTDTANIVMNESTKLTKVGITNGGAYQNIVAIGY